MANPQVDISEEERDTILAALRLYQKQFVLPGIPDAIMDIATNGESHEPLDDEAIETLCERINV